jgi:hypothetical protein
MVDGDMRLEADVSDANQRVHVVWRVKRLGWSRSGIGVVAFRLHRHDEGRCWPAVEAGATDHAMCLLSPLMISRDLERLSPGQMQYARMYNRGSVITPASVELVPGLAKSLLVHCFCRMIER